MVELLEQPIHKKPAGHRRRDDASPLLILLALAALPVVIVYGMAWGNEVQVFGIIVAVCAAVLCLAQPFYGLLIFLGLLYTRPEESVPELAGMHFTLAIALLTLLGMVVKQSLDRTRFVQSPVVAMVAGLFVTATISLLPSRDVMGAVEDVGRLLVLVLLVINLVRSDNRFKTCVDTLIALSVYLSAYSLYLYFTGNTIHQDGELRSHATGIFADPNDLAATIVPAIALTVMRFCTVQGAKKAVYAAVGMVLFAGVMIADSRGGTLALIATFIGFVLTSRMTIAKKVMLLACSLLMFVVGSGRMTNFDPEEASANSRFWFWDNGIVQLLSHPVLGVGYDQFASVNGGMVAHNSFVQCFAEVGLIGYFFWIGAIYFSLRNSRIAAATATDSGLAGPNSATDMARPGSYGINGVGLAVRDLEVKGARIALIAYLVASFWLSHTFNPVLYVMLCLPLIAQARPEDAPARSVRPWEYTAIASICVGSIIFIKLFVDYYK